METGRGKKSKKTGWHLTSGNQGDHLRRGRYRGFDDDEFRPGSPGGPGRYLPGGFLLGADVPGRAQNGPVDAGAELPADLQPRPRRPREPVWLPYLAPVAPAVAPPVQAPATVPVAVKPEKPGSVVTGSVVPLSPPVPAATAKKKGKTGTIHKDPKAREEEMRRMRQEVVQKLKFQNSFDKDFKARLPKSKDHEKAQAKAGGAQSQPTQVRIAQYRNSKEAQAKVTELQKKGIKATVRKAKDSKGTLYVVCKPEAAHHADTEKLAKKPEKSSGSVKKLRIE